MKRKNFLALVMCFFLTLNTFIMGTVSAESDILYYGAHKTVEVSGQTDELYANKFVTLVLKAEDKILSMGETQIDMYGKYNYSFKINQLPEEAELLVKCANENITSTAYETIIKTQAFVKVNYRTEESDGKITILADMTPILEKSESYTAVAAQYNSYGVLVDCRIFKSSDLENAASFEKTIDEKGYLKFFVWTSMEEMLPSAYATEGGGKLLIKFGAKADKQSREGYAVLDGENNYELFKSAKAELPEEFNVANIKVPEIKREFYVSENGDDNASGDINSPFATIEKALSKYNDLSDEEKLDWTAIYLREGEYTLDSGVSLKADRLYIGSFGGEKVKIENSAVVFGDKLTKVDASNTSEKILNIINPDAKNMYYIDYADLGIEKMPGYSYGTSGTKPYLSVNGKNQQISRYPNSGDTYISKVIDAGYDENGDYTENVEFTPTDKKPFSWVQTQEVRLSGQLCVTWYYNHMEASFDNEKGTVKTPSTQTVVQGNKCAVNLVNHPEDRAHFYYYNVFEEIDMPGEWCSSDAEKRIYINLENEPSATDEIKICSQSTDKLFDISDSRDVVFDGIEFENARSAASVTGSERVVFKNCRFENIIKTAVTLNCSEFSGVLSSEFKNVSGGVGIEGNRNNIINLKAERNFVQNCHFNKVSGSCIKIGASCGNIISHNLAENYNGSYLGIFGGCENVFEYNESASGGFNGNEANIVYIDGCYQARYNHIRYNYIHDNSPDPKKILLGCGVVVDDMGESNLVYGNILENLGISVSANGGDNNIFDSNVIIDCITKYGATDAMYAGESRFDKMTSEIDKQSGYRFGNYFTFGLAGAKWGARYKAANERMTYLKGIRDKWNSGDKESEDVMFARAATGNYFTNNVTVNSAEMIIGPQITDFYSYDNPEENIPQNNGNDYSVSYNNREETSINLSEISYFDKIGIVSEPKYENTSDKIEIVYPNITEKISGKILEAVWKDIDNATGYRLTVSDKADMSNVLYEKPLIENRATQEVQIYSDKDVTYYYQISALNSKAENEVIALSDVKAVTFNKYTQLEDIVILSPEKTNIVSTWTAAEGNQYIRHLSKTCTLTQMSDEGSYIRFDTDGREVKNRMIYGKNPYDEVEKMKSIYDPKTTVSTMLKVRFPDKDKFGKYVSLPFIQMSPSKFADVSYGSHGKAAMFRIAKEDEKYVLYKELNVMDKPLTKIGECSENDLFGRWIDVSVDINMETGVATLCFDNKYNETIDMNQISWEDTGYSWNSGNYLRFYDLVFVGDGTKGFTADIKDISVTRKVNK